MRLIGCDGYPGAVGTLVGPVKVRAAIAEIVLAFIHPHAGGFHAVDHRHQRGDPVRHRDIDDLAGPGGAGMDDAGKDAEGEIEGTSADIANNVDRRDGPFLRTDRVQRAGDR